MLGSKKTISRGLEYLVRSATGSCSSPWLPLVRPQHVCLTLANSKIRLREPPGGGGGGCAWGGGAAVSAPIAAGSVATHARRGRFPICCMGGSHKVRYSAHGSHCYTWAFLACMPTAYSITRVSVAFVSSSFRIASASFQKLEQKLDKNLSCR